MAEDQERPEPLPPAPTPRGPPDPPTTPPAADAVALTLAGFAAWPAPEAIIARDGTLLVVNDAWRQAGRAEGGGAAVEVGANYLAVCDAAAGTADEADGRAVGQGLRDVLEGRRHRFDHTYRCDDPAGGPRWFQLTASRIAGPTPAAMIEHTDVTHREQLQSDVRARSHLLDQVDAAIIVTDLTGAVTLWSRGAEQLFGWAAEEALGRSASGLVATEGAPPTAEVAGRITTPGSSGGEVTFRRRDDTTFPAHVRNTVVHDATGTASGSVGISIDLTAQRAIEDQLVRSHRELQAVTDGMGDGVGRCDAAGSFTYVNAQALRLLRAEVVDVIGSPVLRWLHPRDRPHASALAAAGSRATPGPVESTLRRGDGTQLPIEYLATPLAPGGDGPRDWVVVFRDITERVAREAALGAEVERLRCEQRIRDALAGDGLLLHAQPIVDIATGEVTHHELLVRMRDPADPTRLIAPDDFIPTAEASGLAPLIDRWVIGQAIELAAAGHYLHLHLNLSATSLADATLPDEIGDLIVRAGVAPEQLIFEVTESALLEDIEAARHFLEQLRAFGCGLALDDFGTGYGGFTYLKQLHVDVLKIDIEFVSDAVTSAASRHVIAAVVSLAHAFGLRTVAEGVEDEATLEVLRLAGVDLAQGYLFGRPGPLPDTAPTREESA